MKTNNRFFWMLTLLCGSLGCILRILMMRTGLDESGLLKPFNLPHYGLWILSIGFLILLLMNLKKLGADGCYKEFFPASRLQGFLSMAGGLLLIGANLGQLFSGGLLMGLAGILAGIGMILVGLCRIQGERPSPMFHSLLCIFYVLRLVISFRSWSADPQLQDYALQLLACINLMLLSFHRASCDARIIERRRTVFLGLAAVYFCMCSLSDASAPLFYAASGLWAAGSLCSLIHISPESNP